MLNRKKTTLAPVKKSFILITMSLLILAMLCGCGQTINPISDKGGETSGDTAPADSGSQNGQANTIILKIDSNIMIINDVSKPIDAPPIIQNERTLVPVRVVSEALNASVYWLEKTKQVRIVQGAKEIILTIGSKEVSRDGAIQIMDVEPMIVGTRTYVPLRFISENLGAEIEWNNSTREITITR